MRPNWIEVVQNAIMMCLKKNVAIINFILQLFIYIRNANTKKRY